MRIGGVGTMGTACGCLVITEVVLGKCSTAIEELHGRIERIEPHCSRDRVERGATLGYVGNTGGLSRPALYFEVRRGGKTINPQSWLASR